QIDAAAAARQARAADWRGVLPVAARAFDTDLLARAAAPLAEVERAALDDALASSAQPRETMAAALLYLRLTGVREYALVRLVGDVLTIEKVGADKSVRLTLRGDGVWVDGRQRERGTRYGAAEIVSLMSRMLPA